VEGLTGGESQIPNHGRGQPAHGTLLSLLSGQRDREEVLLTDQIGRDLMIDNARGW
jgi:hypothetical protein